jgi:tRNA(fMet)-specific endonuclease VapC
MRSSRAINQRLPNVRRRLETALAAGTEIGIPVITVYEIWYGIRKSGRPQANAAAFQTFLTLDIRPWSFDPEDGEEAGDIRAALERQGTPVGPYDVLIAAQARRRGAVLVTANTAESSRVPGLKTQD